MEAGSVESDTRYCGKKWSTVLAAHCFVGWRVRRFYMIVKSPVCINLYEIWGCSSAA
jgi:hypothetical protein